VRKILLERCSQDFGFWVNIFVCQFNPRKKGDEKKLEVWVNWPYEEAAFKEILAAVSEGHDLVIKKSREMGATWMVLLAFVWHFLFHSWSQFLCISRNEAAVDDESPDSIFWKIDHVLDHLPGWMRPRIKRGALYFKNLDNHSVITGQASTGKAGVGGRATAMLVDEYAQIREDTEVLDRTSDTTSCRIFTSTHVGTATAFFQLTKRSDMRQLTLHWSDHPEKRKGLYRIRNGQIEILDKTYPFMDYAFNTTGEPSGGPMPGVRSPWYDLACTRKSSQRGVAEDLDINPEGSVSQVFKPLMIIPLIEEFCRPPMWEGDLEYDHESAQPLKLVARKGGPLRIWCPLTISKDTLLPPLGYYAIGSDVAAGGGASPSCLTGGNCETGEKVFEYVNAHILPDPLGRLTVALCRLFRAPSGGVALLAWEHHGPGVTFANRVKDLLAQQEGTVTLWRRSLSILDPNNRAADPGFISTPASKRALVENYMTAIYERKMLNPSERAMRETLEFRYKPDGSVEHSGEPSQDDHSGARVNHGDLVISDALCWKQISEFGMLGIREKEEAEQVAVGSLQWRRDLHKMADRKPEWARLIR
jgi:hypothetical protein